MAEYNLSYREVIPDQTTPATWKEVSLNTGGTQSTLQDIKIADRANGYCYRDATKHLTRNRFIYWRLIKDTLELVELSLDINLSGNRIRYKFLDTPILDGITIHETYQNVVILVPTVCSVHRLIFPHPDRLYRKEDYYDSHPDIYSHSIFSDVATSQNRDTQFYVYTGPSSANSQLPHSAASWLTLDEEAVFLLAYPSSEVILVRQQTNCEGETIELKYESMMPKFVSGMFRSKNKDKDVIVSMILHTIGIETYAITLCRDGQLRVWSCSKAQCIAVSDILLESMSGRNFEQGAPQHILKKVVGADATNFMFAVYLSFSNDSHFDILRPMINGGHFNIVKIYSLYSPGVDLIDFSLTPSKIWSVWRGKEGEWKVYTASFHTDNDKNTKWIPVVLETLPNPDELSVPDSMEPRQAYLDYIFHPGRFPLHIISKALKVYTLQHFNNLSLNVLKQQVCMAVETKVEAELQECEVSDEDYLETVNWCWSRFFSGCVQYHVAGLRPLGILLLPSVSGAVLLKKSAYSFLRPLDVLEHLMNCSEFLTVNSLYGNPQLSNTKEECNDIISLANVLVYLDEQIDDVLKTGFEEDMSQSVPPGDAIDEMLSEVVLDRFYIKEEINKCSDLYSAMHKLLELLRMDQPIPENEEFPKELKTSVMHLFGSQLGISVIGQCFIQQTNTKFTICRNLLILQRILLEENANGTTLEAIRSVCMPEVIILLQSYYALCWLSQQTATPVLPLEVQSQRLSSLKLNPIFNLKNSSYQNILLLELYAASTGGIDAHKALLKYDFDEESLSHWHTALLPYLTQLTLIIWPINGNAAFTEWLLSSGQHIHLQQYVSLIDSWCDWNNLTRCFLLAVSFLNSSEIQKAYDLFLLASKGIFSDQFLMERIGSAEGSKAYILYYLKVIQLFELHEATDYAIEVANAALACAIDDTEPLKNTLFSIKFKHHLALGHYNEAFEALAANPDKEGRKDNLRNLVKTLLDGKFLDKLLSFNYDTMEELFLSILLTHARATDAIYNIYYDFLYAFCIKKQFTRLAANVIYEHAYRLRHNKTLEALEQQVKCYLASVNALSLTSKEFSWVLKPADPDLEEEVHILPPLIGSDDEDQTVRFKRFVEVSNIEDIRKELIFSKARLQLARLDPKSIKQSITTPQELVILLAWSGIYHTAFTVCTAFNIPYDGIFDLLTHQCIQLSDQDSNAAWNWLVENELHDMDFIPNSPAGVAWALLKKYLLQYEEDKMSRYHRIVAEILLMSDNVLPEWFVISYKLRNPAELLRVYYFTGLLKEASFFAMDYLKAALGYGPEYFGLSHCLAPGAPQLCLPLNVIDALVYELEIQNEENPLKPLEKEHEMLKDLFLKYMETSARISYEMCQEKMMVDFTRK